MSIRDPLKDQAWWDARVPAAERILGRYQGRFAAGDQTYSARLGDAFSIAEKSYGVVSALYSANADVEVVAKAATQCITRAYPQFVLVCREQPAQAKREYAGGWDSRYKYLSLAILCRLTAEETRPLVEALDFWEEPDAGMERMIAHLGHGEGREPTEKLLWPDAYAPLLGAMDPEASEIDRTSNLRTFLKNWLKQMRASTNPAYSNHDNTHNTYVGYWCWEAAAVSVMMNISDSAFTDHDNYPTDFANWARLNR